MTLTFCAATEELRQKVCTTIIVEGCGCKSPACGACENSSERYIRNVPIKVKREFYSALEERGRNVSYLHIDNFELLDGIYLLEAAKNAQMYDLLMLDIAYIAFLMSARQFANALLYFPRLSILHIGTIHGARCGCLEISDVLPLMPHLVMLKLKCSEISHTRYIINALIDYSLAPTVQHIYASLGFEVSAILRGYIGGNTSIRSVRFNEIASWNIPHLEFALKNYNTALQRIYLTYSLSALSPAIVEYLDRNKRHS